MERLTYWREDGAGGGEWRINANGKEYSGPGVDRLAAYENTGQEPGGVLRATDLEKVACALHELNQYKELGTLDRLRCAIENLADAEARAEEAETMLATAVRDMEAMALTIRRRTDYDTECCPFCHYDCPEEDYCPGWEGEECFRWRGVERPQNQTENHFPDVGKMVPLALKQLMDMDIPTPIWAEVEGKTIEGWNGYWCLCQKGKVLAPSRIVMQADQMGEVMFYHYPPAHIDREAWEPCRVCGQYEVLGFRGWRRQENMLKPPDGSGGCMYCPHCGRPRNEKAWVQLEQRLRGEQVDEPEKGRSEAGDAGPLLLP